MSSRDRNGVLPSREWRDMRSHDETYNGSPAPVAPASLGSLQSALAQQDPRFGSPTAKLPFSGDAAEVSDSDEWPGRKYSFSVLATADFHLHKQHFSTRSGQGLIALCSSTLITTKRR